MLLVADGGVAAGLGHLQRSSVLAGAVAELGLETRCLAHGASEVITREGVTWEPVGDPAALAGEALDRGAVVADSYTLDGGVLGELAQAAPLVVIHDLGQPHPDAALVIAPADPAASTPRRLNGLEHALVSRRFSGLPAREVAAAPRVVLVTTGGGDPGGRAVELAATARTALADASVLLLQGPQAELAAPDGVEALGPVADLAELLRRVDLVVCGGGGTMVEVCAAGLPAAVTVLAANQAPIVEALATAGAVVRLDRGDPVAVLRALADRDRRAELGRTARAVVDGQGPARIAAAIADLLDEVSPVAPAPA